MAPAKLADTIEGISGTRNLSDNLSDLKAQVSSFHVIYVRFWYQSIRRARAFYTNWKLVSTTHGNQSCDGTCETALWTRLILANIIPYEFCFFWYHRKLLRLWITFCRTNEICLVGGCKFPRYPVGGWADWGVQPGRCACIHALHPGECRAGCSRHAPWIQHTARASRSENPCTPLGAHELM